MEHESQFCDFIINKNGQLRKKALFVYNKTLTPSLTGMLLLSLSLNPIPQVFLLPSLYLSIRITFLQIHAFNFILTSLLSLLS
jgi:hypothetical protein